MKDFTHSTNQVLASGWWLAARSWHPCAWAQAELLARLSADLGERGLVLAWPRQAPDPGVVDWDTFPAIGGAGRWGRLVFEQVGLPRAAAQLKPKVVLVPYAAAPLASQAPIVALADAAEGRGLGGAGRLRLAAARAGLGGVRSLLYAADEPPPAHGRGPMRPIAPAVAPRFRPQAQPKDDARRRACGLPDSYVLALGCPQPGLRLVLSAWSWMAPSLGTGVSLAIGPLAPGAIREAGRLALALELEASVRLIERIPWDSLPAVLRGASCVMFGPRIVNYQLLRWALAAGRPVAAAGGDVHQSILGPAGFVVAPGDSRALGAAGLSLMVDADEIARRLSEAGLARADSYHRSWGDGTLGSAVFNKG